MTVGASRGSRPSRLSYVVLGVAIVALAASLRAAVSSVGVLLPDLRDDLGLSAPTVSLLTSLPLWCFAVVGLGGGRILLRVGVHRATVLLLAAVAVGMVVRAVAGSATGFLLATAVTMGAAALGNVALPPLTRLHFPTRVALVSGVYGATLVGGAAVPAALSAPIASATDWRWALGCWAVVPLLALVLWLPALRAPDPAEAPQDAAPADAGSVLRSPLAWGLLLCFAAQSTQAYVQFGYWGDLMVAAGTTAAHGGALLSLIAACGIPVAMSLPTLIRLTHGSVVLPVAFGVISSAGWIGVIVDPLLLDGWLWAFVLGVGGGAFPWCLAMIGLRSVTTAGSARLSAFVQGGGYLGAAFVTFGAGLLREATGTWTAPVVVMVGLGAVIAATGAVAVRARPCDG